MQRRGLFYANNRSPSSHALSHVLCLYKIRRNAMSFILFVIAKVYMCTWASKYLKEFNVTIMSGDYGCIKESNGYGFKFDYLSYLWTYSSYP